VRRSPLPRFQSSPWAWRAQCGRSPLALAYAKIAFHVDLYYNYCYVAHLQRQFLKLISLGMKDKNMLRYQDISQLPNDVFPEISGSEVVRLMRAHNVSIRQFASVHGMTLKRIRELRVKGIPAGFRSWEFHRMIQMAMPPTDAPLP
jgi:hypothetical protein